MIWDCLIFGELRSLKCVILIFRADRIRKTQRRVTQTTVFLQCRSEDERGELSSAKLISATLDGHTDCSGMGEELLEFPFGGKMYILLIVS